MCKTRRISLPKERSPPNLVRKGWHATIPRPRCPGMSILRGEDAYSAPVSFCTSRTYEERCPWHLWTRLRVRAGHR